MVHEVIHAGSWSHSFTSKIHDVLDFVRIGERIGRGLEMFEAPVRWKVYDVLVQGMIFFVVPCVLIHGVSGFEQRMQVRT